MLFSHGDCLSGKSENIVQNLKAVWKKVWELTKGRKIVAQEKMGC